MEQIKKQRVAIYIRVSTQEQADEGYGPDYQLQKIKNYIESRERDLEFAGDNYVYRDLAVSGADPADTRPEFTRLCEDVQYGSGDEKPFDIVIVYKLDRFARKLEVLLAVTRILEELKLGFISTQEAIDTSTPFGKAMLGILGVFAELERDMIQERTNAGLVQALDAGTRFRPIFGYKMENKKPQIYTEQAAIVRQMFERFVIDDWSVTEICRQLTDDKVLVPGARPKYNIDQTRKLPAKIKDMYRWQDKTVRTILENEKYMGVYYHTKQKTVTDPKTNKKKRMPLPKEQWKMSSTQHPPIISQDIYEKALDKLSEKRAYSKKKASYLLSGLIKCDACKHLRAKGMPSRVGTQTAGTKIYQCRCKLSTYGKDRCHTVPIPASDFDAFIVAKIEKLINNPALLLRELRETKGLKAYKDTLDRKRNSIQKKLAKIQMQKKNVEQLFLVSDITLETKRKYDTNLMSAEEMCLAEQTDLKEMYKKYDDDSSQIAALEYIKKISEDIPNLFSDERKCKKLLNMLIDKIVVYSKERNDIVFPGKAKDIRRVPDVIVVVFKLPDMIVSTGNSLEDIAEDTDLLDFSGDTPIILVDEEGPPFEGKQITLTNQRSSPSFFNSKMGLAHIFFICKIATAHGVIYDEMTYI